MKTFYESLSKTKNTLLLKECFVLMSQKGVDPNKFVEWYCSEGFIHQKNGNLPKQLQEWAISEGAWGTGLGATAGTMMAGPIGGAVGGYLGNKVGNWLGTQFNQQQNQPADQNQPNQNQQPNQNDKINAAKALTNFHKFYQNSPSLQQQINNPEFNNALTGLIGMLNDPKLETIDYLYQLQKQYNIDPLKLVDWYIKEGQYLNESIGDWARNAWGSAKNMLSRFQQMPQNDQDALNQLNQAIAVLKNSNIKNVQFKNALQIIQNSLNKSSSSNPNQKLESYENIIEEMMSLIKSSLRPDSKIKNMENILDKINFNHINRKRLYDMIVKQMDNDNLTRGKKPDDFGFTETPQPRRNNIINIYGQ
jgi:hypothetical protein